MIDSPSLLITDDDRAFRESLRSVFEPRGFRTLLAADGVEALKIVEREPVHVVLLDLQMPRLGGLETARQVQRIKRPLPCILISGAIEEEGLYREAREAELFFSILCKPVDLRDVTSSVREALRITYDWPGRSSGPSSEWPRVR
jgi:CheY-like chemotaxis protein